MAEVRFQFYTCTSQSTPFGTYSNPDPAVTSRLRRSCAKVSSVQARLLMFRVRETALFVEPPSGSCVRAVPSLENESNCCRSGIIPYKDANAPAVGSGRAETHLPLEFHTSPAPLVNQQINVRENLLQCCARTPCGMNSAFPGGTTAAVDTRRRTKTK